MSFSKWLFRWSAVAIFVLLVWIQGCGSGGRQSGDQFGELALTGELAEGKNAAKKYCSTCHLPVDPGMLDKETWKNRVLPAMAEQLGIEVWQKTNYFHNARSVIPLSDWLKIVAYYDSLAPVQLPAATLDISPRNEWAGFTVKSPPEDTSWVATTTMAVFDTAAKTVYTSSAEVPELVRWDHSFHKERVATLPSPATHILFDKQPVVTTIGEMMARDIPSGAVFSFNDSGTFNTQPIASGLIRTLHTVSADFNRDGKSDYIVSSFGHKRGGLYLYRQVEKGNFEKIPVREVAGATQSVAGDFNGDGWTDIIALFAHADEGIWLFTNDRKGGFTIKNLLRFPPVYGSSSFQLVDFNRDGQLDILYTAGDNSDYSRILKPYHGVYIFSNKGNFKMEQSWFYPVNGATKAVAADFDKDGNMDIACIAFFADLKDNPGEKFLYFRQDKARSGQAFHFQPFSPPIDRLGRWICMDVNDWDGDGDPDIILGNYSQGFLNQDDYKPNWNVSKPFIVLENE